jgi:hypothetical protein
MTKGIFIRYRKNSLIFQDISASSQTGFHLLPGAGLQKAFIHVLHHAREFVHRDGKAKSIFRNKGARGHVEHTQNGPGAGLLPF